MTYWDGVLAAATASNEWNAELARYYWTPMYLSGARLREHLKRERVPECPMCRRAEMGQRCELVWTFETDRLVLGTDTALR